ncbi:GNAT family N-acetyltransferase [Dyadobacter luticola]|uniref:GNAT family N-acetyltransferase n=1 Tax=Dyadobacter luticola TaxID=1979387 RepID=A0A5R9KSN3_9BACT|nr:GNAT family N-acetyltransferase [Dyadobacter luticola]TLU99281.1 GNAT family N-acetyltransferase [Dyadobacter luticola]
MAQLLEWRFQTFEELSTKELYQQLRLRSEVFVLEQRCCFLDADNKDQKCHHLSGYKNGELLAYARIVPPGISYEFPSIGRIVVSTKGRGQGLGIELLHVSIEKLEVLYGKSTIRIGAQLYLKRFYESFGFLQSSEVYPEDDIAHIEMTREAV